MCPFQSLCVISTELLNGRNLRSCEPLHFSHLLSSPTDLLSGILSCWLFEFFVVHAECASILVTLGLLKAKFIWAVLESYHESRNTLENFIGPNQSVE